MSETQTGALQQAVAAGPIVTQVYNNTTCTTQTGAKAIAPLIVVDLANAGPALLFWQASTWTQSAPTGEKAVPVINDLAASLLETAAYFNQSAMHLPLVRRRALTPSLPQGQSMITALSTGITDENDSITMALVDVSDMTTPPQVRLSQIGLAQGNGTYTSQPFSTEGNLAVVSVGATAWSSTPNVITSAVLYVDRQQVAEFQVYANQSSLHLPLVGTDLVLQLQAGGHTLELVAAPGTNVDGKDVWSLHVLEMAGQSSATMILGNHPCQSQPGGGTVAKVPFVASGKAIQLITVQMSGFSSKPTTMLQAEVRVDGVRFGTMQVFANPAETHLPLCGGDVTPGQLPAGPHTIEVVAGPSLITDENDRISITVLEFVP